MEIGIEKRVSSGSLRELKRIVMKENESLSSEVARLKSEKSELSNKISEIEKRLHEIEVDTSLSEEGDILKDRWMQIGSSIFYSYGSIDKYDAYENRNKLDRCVSYRYRISFKGFVIKMSDDISKPFSISNEYSNYSNINSKDLIDIVIDHLYGKDIFITKEDAENELKKHLDNLLCYKCQSQFGLNITFDTPNINIEIS